MRKTLAVIVDDDSDMNTAAITFNASILGREAKQYRLSDSDGNVIGSVTFGASGELAQIELLRADVQLPPGLR
ncbi:hypothetical protein BI335_09700 [Enemella evansiae]|uniref:hypothetical protein n=1 Tax=Enemella evansiae TaxID=2016499 RepID=UPI000B976BDE|nr:hypothetical protein [Enemella evansiae]OYO17012.1 hypothetical protein BI335_09700 [Enemella evansiae]